MEVWQKERGNMKNKVRRITKNMKTKTAIAALAAYAALLAASSGASPVFADKLADAANSAANGISATAVGALKPIIIIILIITGFIFLGVGGHRKKDEAKETAWEKILGIVLIISAAPVAALILGWF